jgi:hypothetical protein
VSAAKPEEAADALTAASSLAPASTSPSPRCPHVYRAINQVIAAFAKAGIAKIHVNAIDQYQYRSIDDVMNRLGPLLARHRLCVLPRALERQSEPVEGQLGLPLVSVRVLVGFDLVSARDGSSHSVRAWGEALDGSDKGTAKAMSSAFKHAMLEVFCIPVSTEDPDAASPRLGKPQATPAPPSGWESWAEDIREMIACCESNEALDRVRTRHTKLLAALKRERPELYETVGKRFQSRVAALVRNPPEKTVRTRGSKRNVANTKSVGEQVDA